MSAVHAQVTSVRNWDGKLEVTSQPQSGPRLPLAGFSVIEAASLEEATEIAKDFPGLNYGAFVEVRPVAPECPLALGQSDESNAQAARASA